MNTFLNFIPLVKETYLKAISPVCLKYNITTAEFDILLFLANNPEFDRATDIVEKRFMVKSQVSTSVAGLEKIGFIKRTYKENDRRTVHLTVTDSAENIIAEGKKAQQLFFEKILYGFSNKKKETMKQNFACLTENMRKFIKEQ